MEIKDTLLMPKGTFPMRANLPQREPLMVENFKKIGLYQMLLKHNEGKPAFYLHDGPPYANNEIHAGHALNKIIKDIIIRSKNLEGFYVPYTPGWDTHGLPIELCVTKSGVDRRTTPPAEFRKKCRDYALTQVDRQRQQILRLGVVGDYDHPYLTLDRDYEG
jgi:isoleucyl-tRNA synthetase